MPAFFDMHCHLDFAPNARDAAAQLQQRGAGAFAAMVLPSAYEEFACSLQPFDRIRVGAGLHPWWVEDDEQLSGLVELACALVSTTRFVGEIGLDFSERHAGTRELQIESFGAVASACAHQDDKVVTLHAVRSADIVLDILQRSGTLDNCACILHWYSGPSDVLKRAIGLGCFFSIGQASLATKRGREYARIIPESRLLLETDYPARGQAYDVDTMQQQLEDSLNQIAAIRGTDPESLAELIAATSRTLLAL